MNKKTTQKSASPPSQEGQGKEAALPKEIVDLIQDAVAKVSHGTVQLVIQDGRVIQIDTTQKNRIG